MDKQVVIDIYVYAIFNSLISLSLPLGIQAIINFIMGGEFTTSWFVLVFLIILGIIVSGGLQIKQFSLAEHIQQRIFAHSAYEFTYRLPRLKRDGLEGHYLPSLVNRFFDVLTLQKGLSKILLDFSRSFIQVIVGVILLSMYHPFFILYGVVLLMLLVVIFRYTAPLGMESSRQESNYKYKLVHWMEEVARTYEGFKMAGRTNFPLDNTNRLVKHYLDHRQAHFKTLKLQYFVMIGFKVFIIGGLLVLGGILVINQQMNIGQFVASEIIIILLLTSVEKLILSFETIYDVLTALEKIGFFTDLPLEGDKGLKIDHQKDGVDVRFKDLSFSNVSDDIQIKELDLNIPAGSRIAVAGVNRSGKSLLLEMASGQYRDFSGTISYDNIPLGNVDVMHLRSSIGDNLGSDLIFAGSLIDNITLGRPNITQADVEWAVDLVGLRAYVESLKNGYHERLNSGGARLPDGTAVKLELARAFVHKPKLILLEDPFGSMDNESTDKVIQHLLSPELGATVILATTRRKYLKQMKNIVWMESGRLREQGNYNELRVHEDFALLIN